MITYISLLRGINVSGQKLIKMDKLRLMYENMGFKNVRTYLQSGNVIFRCPETDAAGLGRNISKQINTIFGYHVPVHVLHYEDLKKIIEKNSFIKDTSKDPSFLHITFPFGVVKSNKEAEIINAKSESEDFFITGQAIYLYCPDGYGKTILSNNFFEKILGVICTTRKWKSVIELLKIAGAD